MTPRELPERRFARSRAASGVGLALLASSGAALAASDHFAPIGPEFLVNASTNYNQYWSRVAIAPDASYLGFAFSSGQDPYARQFSTAGAPLTSNLWCTPALNVYTQDEPETHIAIDGRQLVAWSERHGYDGEQMGIFGRIFASGGAAVTAEIQINEAWQASQWRPLIARHPGGGWAVAWSGDWDGDAFFRLVNSDGTFRTGDVRVSTFDNGAQVDTAPAIAPDGRMLMVFVDYSGYGAVGSGTNLWARLFDANGVALQTAPFPLNTSAYTAADQREPRAVADGLGRYIVVWEDASKDGSSWGVYGRILDHDAVPIGAEFQLHTNTLGAQRGPRVAADAAGQFLVAWEDWSGADADIRAQRFAANGSKIGSDFVVNTVTAGDQRSAGLAMADSTGHVVVTWEGPGVSTDVYARIFTTYEAPATYCTAKVNSLGCSPQIAWSGEPTLGGADDFHVTASLLLNQKSGLCFWGFAGGALPFYGGTLCVQPPVSRTPVQLSGGSTVGQDCTGTFDSFFSHAYFASKGVVVGDTLFAQFWSRDPGFAPPQSISLSDALSFDVRP